MVRLPNSLRRGTVACRRPPPGQLAYSAPAKLRCLGEPRNRFTGMFGQTTTRPTQSWSSARCAIEAPTMPVNAVRKTASRMRRPMIPVVTISSNERPCLSKRSDVSPVPGTKSGEATIWKRLKETNERAGYLVRQGPARSRFCRWSLGPGRLGNSGRGPSAASAPGKRTGGGSRHLIVADQGGQYLTNPVCCGA